MSYDINDFNELLDTDIDLVKINTSDRGLELISDLNAALIWAKNELQSQEVNWLIWSNAHAAWRARPPTSYTRNMSKAQYFNKDEAIEVCGHTEWHYGVIPNDMPIHESVAKQMPLFTQYDV